MIVIAVPIVKLLSDCPVLGSTSLVGASKYCRRPKRLVGVARRWAEGVKDRNTEGIINYTKRTEKQNRKGLSGVGAAGTKFYSIQENRIRVDQV